MCDCPACASVPEGNSGLPIAPHTPSPRQMASVSLVTKSAHPGGGGGPGQGAPPTDISGRQENTTPVIILKTAAAISQTPKTFGVLGWAYSGLSMFLTIPVRRAAQAGSTEHVTGILAPKAPTKLTTELISQVQKTRPCWAHKQGLWPPAITRGQGVTTLALLP